MTQARLTAKSVADILQNPKLNTKAILHDQKYPSADPQKFRTPYYQGCIAAIRQYFANGNDPKILHHWRNKLVSIKNEARRINNIRALDVFSASSMAKRSLVPTTNKRYMATVAHVDISLSADMQALQAGQLHVVYFHCRGIPMDPQLADLIANVAHWVLDKNGVPTSPSQIEIVDLFVGKTLKASTWMPTIQGSLAARAHAIAQMWTQL
jgi:hypothetical protein